MTKISEYDFCSCWHGASFLPLLCSPLLRFADKSAISVGVNAFGDGSFVAEVDEIWAKEDEARSRHLQKCPAHCNEHIAVLQALGSQRRYSCPNCRTVTEVE